MGNQAGRDRERSFVACETWRHNNALNDKVSDYFNTFVRRIWGRPFSIATAMNLDLESQAICGFPHLIRFIFFMVKFCHVLCII